MNTTQIIGIVAGIFTSTSMLPQLIKVIKEKRAQEISLLMLFVLNTGIALWIVYGLKREDMPIIATNAFSLFVNSILVFFRFKYRHR